MLEGTMAASSATVMQSRHQPVSCSASLVDHSVMDPEVTPGLQVCDGGSSLSKSAWRRSARGWAGIGGGARQSTCTDHKDLAVALQAPAAAAASREWGYLTQQAGFFAAATAPLSRALRQAACACRCPMQHRCSAWAGRLAQPKAMHSWPRTQTLTLMPLSRIPCQTALDTPMQQQTPLSLDMPALGPGRQQRAIGLT